MLIKLIRYLISKNYSQALKDQIHTWSQNCKNKKITKIAQQLKNWLKTVKNNKIKKAKPYISGKKP